jgi:uncharacterized protein
MMNEAAFRSRYGPWALVAGASEGLGAEFARQLAQIGLHVVLVARRQILLEEMAASLERAHGIQTRPIAVDLAQPDAASVLREKTSDLDVGLVVYNAAVSPIGPFLEQDLQSKLRAIDVNCRTPLMMAHEFGRAMLPRKRGGFLIVCSMSAFQGSPLLATYAATKAFGLVLGETLWEEFGRHGIDALAFCAGPTRTPNYEGSQPRKLTRFTPAPMEPEAVVREALVTLGRKPSARAGWNNKFTGLLMSRLLSRRAAVRVMGRATRAMYSSEE